MFTQATELVMWIAYEMPTKGSWESLPWTKHPNFGLLLGDINKIIKSLVKSSKIIYSLLSDLSKAKATLLQK